jgi:hypothetical protein
MNTMPIITDTYGNRYAAVAVEELDEWAWLLTQIEDWLLHAHPDTIADWNEFNGSCGSVHPRLAHVTYMLGHWAIRMRNLAEGHA